MKHLDAPPVGLRFERTTLLNLPTAVILVVIVVLCVFAARTMYDTFTGKGGCHGGGGGSRTKRVRVSDKDEAN